MINGTPTASLTFTVDLDIDTEVWQGNYGLFCPTPKNLRDDIRSYMQEVITELIEQHLDRSGNEGLVHVGYKV